MNCRWIVGSYQLPVASCQLPEDSCQLSVVSSQLNAEKPITENRKLKTRNSELGTRNFRLSTQYSVLSTILLLLLLAACQPGAPSALAPTESVLEVKLLATVYISPTPNQAEVLATRQAFTPTPQAAVPTATPTATAYVGVFLGEVEADEGPAFGLAQQPPTPNVIATQLPNCAATPDPIFGPNWNTDSEVPHLLGCPIQITAQFRGVTQVFERGVMYWRGDTGEIWAIATSGPASGRYWRVEQSAEAMNEDIQAPAGLRAPVRGFGGVWRNTPEVRDALGFARTDEQELAMQSQRFDGGLLFLDSSAGLVFALMVDGTAYGPFPL